jgi:ATP-dependent DNA helicase DinG
MTSLQLVPKSPIEMGFPAKFDKWRKNQPETIEASLTSNKRVVAHCSPTGSGKSQCYMSEAILAGGRTCFLTGTKGLQDQNVKSYSSIGLVDIRGKANYNCTHRPDWTCKDGHAGSCPYKGSTECGYSLAYNTARGAKLVQTSYDFWISIHRYGLGLGEFDRLVIDEGHLAPDKVAESMQVTLSHNEVCYMLGVDFPPGLNVSGEVWRAWAIETKKVAQKKLLEAMSKIQRRDAKQAWIKEYHHYKNLCQKLSTLSTIKVDDWVWEMFENKDREPTFQFDPIRFTRYTESRLFRKVPKISIYSATIRPKTLNMMGIANDDFDFYEWPSIFDPKRSPVYTIPTMRVDRHSPDVGPLALKIDQFVRPRWQQLHRNGVVHVTSFDYRNKIIAASKIPEAFISHYNREPASEAVKRFEQSGGVLISPSVMEGYDFIGDLCRFNIMTKVPFLPSSKVIKAREQADKLFGPYYAFQKIMQSAGRGTREDVDWCENAIMDDHFTQWFLKAYRFLATQSFLERLVQCNTIPKPLIV